MNTQSQSASSATINNSELARLAELAQLVTAAQDAMSDDIVMRLASAMSDGIALLDRVNRSGVDRALPVLTELVKNNDLPRLVDLARLVASIQDSMSDDIVARLASAMSEGITLLDRLTRNNGLMRLLQVLESPESQEFMIGFAEALRDTSRDVATTAPARGGWGGLLSVAREPGTQEGIRILAVLGQYLSRSLREQHRRGG